MHKKTLKIFIKLILPTLCILFSKAHAVEILPELRASYYIPTDSRFHDIYSGAGLYSIETSVETWENLYPWASFGFLYKSGASKGENNGTNLYLVPIGIGLKYFFHFEKIHPYLGAGMVVAYTHVHNHSSYVTKSQSKWGVGGIAKTGVITYFLENLFFDFFLDYTYLKMSLDHPSKKHVATRRADLSGISIGGGIGYAF